MLTILVLITLITICNTAASAGNPAHNSWQWRWQVWLPDKWQRVGVCETGLNFDHANSDYVSAFGISRGEYDRDARTMGAPRWSDRVHPSPWFQYRAALGHYKLHHGFAGWGCRGA